MNLIEYINKGLTSEEYITRVEDDLENEVENDDPKEYQRILAAYEEDTNRRGY